MKEFKENGMKEEDIITKDSWFLTDILKEYENHNSGATLTPSDNMNL